MMMMMVMMVKRTPGGPCLNSPLRNAISHEDRTDFNITNLDLSTHFAFDAAKEYGLCAAPQLLYKLNALLIFIQSFYWDFWQYGGSSGVDKPVSEKK